MFWAMYTNDYYNQANQHNHHLKLPHLCVFCENNTKDVPSQQISSIQYSTVNYSHHAVH